MTRTAPSSRPQPVRGAHAHHLVPLLVLFLVVALGTSVGCAPACQPPPREDKGGIEADLARFEQLVVRACLEAPYRVECALDAPLELQRIRGGIAAGRITLDAALFEACLASDDPTVLNDLDLGSRSPCRRLFVARSPVGDACDTGLACVDGYCARDDYSRSPPTYEVGACGVCAPRGEAGAACSGHGWIGASSECADGTVCDDGSDQCRRGGQHEDPCGGEDGCDDGLTCRDGTCRFTDLRDGQMCTAWSECASGYCADTCQAVSEENGSCTFPWQCVPGMTCTDGVCTPAMNGDECWPWGDPDVPDCGDGTVCDFDETLTDAYSYLCRPVLDVAHGASCQEGVGACLEDHACRCPPGDFCDSTCTRLIAPGEACGPGDTCVRGTACTGGVCAQLPDLGAPCDDLCGRGTCVDGTCASLAPGDSCAPPVVANGDTCGEGAACQNEVCVDEPTEGEPCVTACDRALYCADTGLCTPICVL